MEAIGVAVAHEDAAVARAVGEVIEASGDLFVAGTSPEAGAVVVAGGEALLALPRAERPVVALAADGSIRDARAALALGARDLIGWPEEAALLPGAVRRAAAPADPGGPLAPVIAVAGARGGVGASTVAAMLAARLPRAILVDLDPAGAGARALCRDDDPPTWEPLARAREVREDALETLLSAHAGSARALHAPRLAADPDPAVARALVRAARGVGAAVVVDCGRAGSPAQQTVVGEASRRVLVAADDVASVRSAVALRARHGDWALVVVRARVLGVPVRDLAAAVGARPAAVLSRDRALARCLDVGRLPPRTARPSRAVKRLARALELGDA